MYGNTEPDNGNPEVRDLDTCVEKLDKAIRMRRNIYDEGESESINGNDRAQNQRVASHYIDAYQCVRVWITGETLP